ncbi:MAG: diguanylate cyclase [Aphanocapsa sp. GSE-SYN-MK-11-07L]|jgi:diguanylate cyclase (GGDEF)-like protein|nr:diguanylate cyclase [Aphanocapsa sp. GSE-SYN-MK-11-07L]
MNSQEALDVINQILSPQSLSHIQELVFHHSWNQKTYKEIAVNIGYDSDYVKEIGSELWQMLSHALGRRVTKKNVQIILAEQTSGLDTPAIANPQPFPLLSSPFPIVEFAIGSSLQTPDWHHFENYLHQEWQQLLADAAVLSELIPTLTSLSLILCEVDRLQVEPNVAQAASHVFVQQVANVLEQQLKRPKDLLGYHPTGKFAILLPQTQARGAVHLAETMRVAIKQLKLCQPGFAEPITLSLGVATTSPNPQSTPNDLLIASSQTLQQAQQQGCDRVIYKPI